MARGAFRVHPNPQNARDISFEVVSDVPEDQAHLQDEVTRTLTALNILFPQEAGERAKIRFQEHYDSLLKLAQVGLVGDNAQPELAQRALLALKDDITAREAGTVKNRYMKGLGKDAFKLGGLPLLAGFIVKHYAADLPIGSFLVLWGGCMAGVWLSYGARKTILRFEDLYIPEEDRLEPLVRLIFSGLLAVTFGLLFSTQAVTITVGKMSTNDLLQNTQIALLVGLILGFSEKTLPAALASRISSFLSTPD